MTEGVQSSNRPIKTHVKLIFVLRRIRLTRHFSRTYPVRRLGIAIPGYPGIPAEFSNPVFSGLAASNPGITGLKNCLLYAYKSVIK